MNWKFWTKGEKADDQAVIKQLYEQVNRIGECLIQVSAQVTGNSTQLNEIGGQVNKVARIQYKTGQDMQNKLERLSSGMDDLQHWQAAHDVNVARLNILEQQIENIAESLIHWLDDIDLVCSRLQGEEQEMWRQLLQQWARQILGLLTEAGIRELDVIGRSFDPRWAESISTAARNPAMVSSSDCEEANPFVPYQVVEVIKRGFALSDGRLLRKAQVITLQEESSHEQQ